MSQCYICHDMHESTHSHHTIPQSAGGVNSQQIPLCANCHNSVHRELNRMMARYRKKLDVGTIKWTVPKHPNEIQIATQVVMVGLKGVIDYEQSDSKEFLLQIRLPKPIHAGLSLLRKQGGVKSLEQTILQCIIFALKSKGIKI